MMKLLHSRRPDELVLGDCAANVEAIEIGVETNERLYFVRYSDGEAEHLTCDLRTSE